jgi:hypothetical protein
VVAAFSLVLAIVVIAWALVAGLGGLSSTDSAVAPGPGQIARYRVDGVPQPLVVGDGAAWTSVSPMTSRGTGTPVIWRIDAKTAEVTSLPGTQGAVWVATGEGSVWATCNAKACGGRAVLRLDPSSGAVLRTLPVPSRISQITTGLGAVWVTTEKGLVRMDPDTGVATTLSSASYDLVGAGGGGVWVSTEGHGLSRIDPASGDFTVTVGFPDPCTMDVAAEAVFVASCDGGAHAGIGHDELMALDATTGEVLYRVPLEISGQMREAEGTLWLAGSDPVRSGFIRILRLDPSTGQPVEDAVEVRQGAEQYRSLSMFPPHVFFSTGEGSLWVTDFAGGQVIRLPVESSSAESHALVLRVTCGADGHPNIQTPVVQAQSDGLHVLVDNQAGAEAIIVRQPSRPDVSWSSGSNGLDDEFPMPVPPGRSFVSCFGPGPSPAPSLGASLQQNEAAFEVVDPNGYWSSTDLVCPAGERREFTVSTGVNVSPRMSAVEAATTLVPGVRPTDVVELADYGYLGFPRSGAIRVIRGGRIVAWTLPNTGTGTWSFDGYACPGSGISA